METPIINDTIQIPSASTTPRCAFIASILERVTLFCLHASIFLLPLWFFPATIDVLELNKQALLVLFSSLALVSWIGAAILRKTFSLSRSWMHVVVAAFAVISLIAGLLSQDRYLSLAGNIGQMSFSFATIFALFVWYLVATNTIKSTTRAYDFLLTYLTSGIVVAVFGLCQALGISAFNPLTVAMTAKSFYTVGSVTAFGGYLASVAVVAGSLLVLGCKNDTCVLGKKTKIRPAAAGIVWTSLVLSLLGCVVADSWISWVTILFGMVLVCGISMLRRKSVGHPVRLIVPGLMLLLSVALLIWKAPFSANIPGDVTPSPMHSWQVVTSVLQTSPLFGTGAGTWMYDYALYHSASANLSPYWATHFDQAYSAFFSTLATLGIVGTISWLLILLSGMVLSAMHLYKEKNDDVWQAYLTVFSGWCAMAIFGLFSNIGISHQFVFWFFLAILAALSANGSFSWNAVKRPLVNTVLSVVLAVLVIGTFSICWLTGQRLASDAAYTSAVISFRAGGDVQASINQLQNAIALNHLSDVYERNLSQAYLVKATKLFQSTDAQKNTGVADAVHAAIDAARLSTTMNPANVDNWSNLAVIYQTIAPFTAGADELAIQNYQEALKREPNNPSFSTEIGKIYILRADAYRTQLSSKDEKTRTDAETKMQTQLQLAETALRAAIQAKQDYAPAHYALGILFERQGHLKDAITKLEQVLAVNKQDVGVGFQLSILYYRNGNYDKAQYVLEQIEHVDPTFANAPWYLASLYADAGRLDDAIAQLQSLKKMYPDNADVQTRLDALQKQKDSKSKPSPQPMPEPIPQSADLPATAPAPVTK